MKKHTRILASRWVFLLAGQPGLCVGDEALTRLKPFLQEHCYDCHGAEKQKGDYRFDTLGTDLRRLKTLEAWQAILDQLNLGEMPPEKRPQPGLAETEPFIEALTAELARVYAESESTGGQTILRRLNRHEPGCRPPR